MATRKQEKLAKNIVMGRAKTLYELLISSGYSETTAKSEPGLTIAKPGVQKILEKLGFTEEAAKARVAEILLNGEDNDALKAADMIFKAKGTYAPIKSEATIKGYMALLLKEIEDEQGGLIKESNN